MGGGSVVLARDSRVPVLANDINKSLAALFLRMQRQDEAFVGLWKSIAKSWDEIQLDGCHLDRALSDLGEGKGVESHLDSLSSLLHETAHTLHFHWLAIEESVAKDIAGKWKRIQGVQSKKGARLSLQDLERNLETALRSALYYRIRDRHNLNRYESDDLQVIDFWLIRELCYASMFRFSKAGAFNVPYGGVSYNRKSLFGKVEQALSTEMKALLQSGHFYSLDFEEFLRVVRPQSGDFVFVDPPYDTEFSAYDGIPFDREAQQRLARVLSTADAAVMLVIKDSPLMRELYGRPPWNITETSKVYSWTIKDRNNRNALHLVVRNY